MISLLFSGFFQKTKRTFNPQKTFVRFFLHNTVAIFHCKLPAIWRRIETSSRGKKVANIKAKFSNLIKIQLFNYTIKFLAIQEGSRTKNMACVRRNETRGLWSKYTDEVFDLLNHTGCFTTLLTFYEDIVKTIHAHFQSYR